MDADAATPDAQPADSSPAPVASVPPLESFSKTEYDTFFKTGEIPKTPNSDSSSATPEDRAASTDASRQPASEAGKPADRPRKNAKDRIPEVDADIQTLQDKLKLRGMLREELARTERPERADPASQPARPPSVQEWQRYKAHPDAPKQSDFDDYEDFVVAMSTFVADQRYEARQQQATRERQITERDQEISTLIASAQKDIADALAADPTLEDQVDLGLLKVVPAFALPPDVPIRAHNVAAAELFKSSVKVALLKHFSTPDGKKEWVEMCQMGPSDLLRKFGRIEARFESRATAADPKPAVKTVTSAPDPPMTLGRQPADPADEVAAALKDGDFARYYRAENARSLARLR